MEYQLIREAPDGSLIPLGTVSYDAATDPHPVCRNGAIPGYTPLGVRRGVIIDREASADRLADEYPPDPAALAALLGAPSVWSLT